MTERIWLAEITAWKPDTEEEIIYYFASSNFLPFEPDDADRANKFYEPRLVDPANITRHVFSEGKVSGKSQVNGGAVEITNADGSYDFLLDYGLDGRSIKIFVGERGQAFSEFIPILDGIMEQPVFIWGSKKPSRIQLQVRDRQAKFAGMPMQTTKFAGTNSGATGVEGLHNDIRGHPKPLCYGRCYNVPAVPVNTTLLIYQVHDDAVQEIIAVYDSGIALTADDNHATLALLQSATIAAGHFDTCHAEGYFRLGGSPAGLITADVKGDATGTGYVISVADIVKRIVTTKGGLSGSELDTSAFTALNTFNNSKVGIYIVKERNIGDALDDLVNSISAWWIFDRTNKLTVGYLAVPSGTPVKIFENGIDLLGINRIAAFLPAYRINLEYKPIWAVQSGDGLAAAVTAERRAFLSKEFRKLTETETDIQIIHPLAIEMNIRTLLIEEPNGEIADLLDIYEIQRQMFHLTIPFTPENAAIDHGDVISIKINRFGMSSGKLFVVIGVLPGEPKRNNITLEVWG